MSELKTAKKEVLLALYNENCIQARHHEEQREKISQIVGAIAAALIGLEAFGAPSNAPAPSMEPEAAQQILRGSFLVVFGILGLLSSWKHYERNRLHIGRVSSIRKRLAEITGEDLPGINKKAERDNETSFPLLSKLKLNWLWSFLHFGVVGVGLIIVARVYFTPIQIKGLSIIILLPIVLAAGSKAMKEWSNRKHVLSNIAKDHALHRPLNARFMGYRPDTADVYLCLVHLVPGAKEAEISFMKMDLWFPVLYGAAFGASVFGVAGMLKKESVVVWCLMPIALIMVADWTENLIQLNQLKSWPKVDARWLKVASYSTMIKLWLAVVTYAGLVIAVGTLFFSNPKQAKTIGRSVAYDNIVFKQ